MIGIFACSIWIIELSFSFQISDYSGNQFLQTREGKIIKGGAYVGHMTPNQTSSEIKKKKVIDIANAFKVLMIYY
jgi:hypothetical protein